MGLDEKVAELVEILGWELSDDVVVEVGGSVVSGIHQPEDANPRWSRQFGNRGYNKDAFIVIKNKTRSPVESSQPPTNEETIDVADGSDGDAGNTGSSST
tara:strand:- start:543 stop:842 length:300 start_codon:yes stop_codon:yes gene_type:complete